LFGRKGTMATSKLTRRCRYFDSKEVQQQQHLLAINFYLEDNESSNNNQSCLIFSRWLRIHFGSEEDVVRHVKSLIVVIWICCTLYSEKNGAFTWRFFELPLLVFGQTKAPTFFIYTKYNTSPSLSTVGREDLVSFTLQQQQPTSTCQTEVRQKSKTTHRN
jgi:hypothetical protein